MVCSTAISKIKNPSNSSKRKNCPSPQIAVVGLDKIGLRPLILCEYLA